MCDKQMGVVKVEVVAVMNGWHYFLRSCHSAEEAEARIMSMIEDRSIEQTDDMYVDLVIKSRKYYRRDNKTLINLEGTTSCEE